MRVILELTEEQADLLRETLIYSQDRGPEGEGWKPPELQALCQLVEDALERAEQAAPNAEAS